MYSNNLLAHMPERRRWIVVVPPAVAQPNVALAVLFENASKLKFGLDILGMHYTKIWPYHSNIRRYSTFFSQADRQSYRPTEPGEHPSVKAVDVHFSNMGRDFLNFNPDLVITMATPVRQGCRSLGANCDYTLGIINAGVPIFVVENNNMPWVNGNQFSESRVVGVMHTDEPLLELEEKASSSPEEDDKIATHIASLIPQGATIQVGIGYLPSLVLRKAAEKIGAIWSEVLTDAIMHMPEGIRMVGTFAIGTRKFYDFLDGNSNVQLLPVEITNGRSQIIERNVISINQAMKVTYGGATIVGAGRRHSGPGGAYDFGSAAQTSIITLRSTHSVTHIENGKPRTRAVSNIVSGPDPRDHIIISPADRPTYVVTEHGIARLRPGKKGDEFCLGSKDDVTTQLIENCVHPDLKNSAWLEAGAADIFPKDRIRRFACSVENRHTGETQMVTFRPIESIDKEAIKAMHRRHSPETILKRFLGMVPELNESMARDFANVDHDKNSEAVGAFLSNGDLVGVARYYLIEDDEAEFAIVVEDAWQRCGLGKKLMHLLAYLALRRGITIFVEGRLAANHEITKLNVSAGLEILSRKDVRETVSEKWRIPPLQILIKP